MELFANIVGNIGVVCFLLAYYLLQRQRVASTGLPYLGLNLAGSLLVLLSLIAYWNFPVFLLEAAWAMISMYGIYTHYLCRR